jgi:uncharacterized coiled-coil protein SlyX
MTVRHEHPDYASKTSLKAATGLVLAAIATLCSLLIFSINKTDGASKNIHETEIKFEKHISDYEHVKIGINEIKDSLKNQDIVLRDQTGQLAEQTQRIANQGEKLDELSNKIENRFTEDATNSGGKPVSPSSTASK